MNTNFDLVMPYVFAEEGGFVNNKKDPGGATNLGVTLATWRAWKHNVKLTADDLKVITQADATPLYKQNYWDTIDGDELPSGLDYAVFDFAVNSGVSRAVRVLQKVLGVDEDGILGSETLAATQSADIADLVDKYISARESFLKSLKTFPVFGHGWLLRTARVRQRSHKLETQALAPAPLMEVPETAKAVQTDVAVPEALKSPEGLAAGGGVLTAVAGLTAHNPILSYAIAAVLVLGFGGLAVYLVKKARSA